MTMFDWIKVEVTVSINDNFMQLEVYDIYPSLPNVAKLMESFKSTSIVEQDPHYEFDFHEIEYKKFKPTKYSEISIH